MWCYIVITVILIISGWLCWYMMRVSNENLLEIRPSTVENSGNGVFLTRPVKMWDILTVSPVEVIPKESLRGSPSENYTFDGSLFGPGLSVLPSGFIRYVNHSDQPNCIQSTRVEQREMVLRALADMPSGTELFINYGEGWWKSRE